MPAGRIGQLLVGCLFDQRGAFIADRAGTLGARSASRKARFGESRRPLGVS
jgi:hypothetical protein